MREFIVSATDRTQDAERIKSSVLGVFPGKKLRVTVDQYTKRRSNEQNALLWAIYGDILKEGGGALAGWTPADLHDLLLCAWAGAETLQFGDLETIRPLRRSSKLTTTEFSDYISFIERFCAEQGIVIRLPGDL